MRHLPLLAVALSLSGWAAGSSKPAKQKFDVPNLGLGNVGGEIPKADDLKKPETGSQDLGLKSSAKDVKYQVVKVEHATDFTGGPHGGKAVGPLEAVVLSGEPPTLQKFATRVRVKASARVNAPIELVILDARGDTALSGNGEVVFGQGDEADYLMDWAPVARPSGGDYKVLVRIAGQPMGTWPLKVVKK
jgi:hypothetical protein